MNFKNIRKHSKKLSAFFAISFLIEIMNPMQLMALTSGPTQPEVQSFQPISVSEMVNPFTGDFSYNIPLIDIDGYPINLSYSSGIGPDQEASWVGLGWNINPGSITRSMRGIPDEFNGDVIETEYNLRPNRTIGASISAGKLDEFLGIDLKEDAQIGLGYSLGISLNNYDGFGIENTITPSFNGGDKAKGLNASLGLTAGQNGLTISPKVTFEDKKVSKDKQEIISASGSIGSSFNSRSGLGALTLSAGHAYKNNKTKVDVSGSFGGSYNFGMPTYTPSINLPMRNLNISFSMKPGEIEILGTSTESISYSGYISEQAMNINKGKTKHPAYGYINAQNVDKDDQGRIRGIMDLNRSWDASYNENTPSLPVTNHTFDILSVTGQGLGGSFRAFRNDIGYVSDNFARNIGVGGSFGAEVGAGSLFKIGGDISVNFTNTTVSNWAPYSHGFYGESRSYSNDAASELKFKKKSNYSHYEPYIYKQMGELSVDDEDDIFSNFGGDKAARIALKSNGAKDFGVEADNSLVYEDGTSATIGRNYRRQRVKRNQTLSIISYADLSYKGLGANDHPIYAAPGHHPGEVSVIRNDGVRYVYGIPAYNTSQEETTFSVGTYSNSLDLLPFDARNIKASIDDDIGLVNYGYNNSDPTWGDNSVNNKRGKDHYYKSTKMPAFAHSYLLSAVLSTDYVDVDGVRGPSSGDIGNYTVFKYHKSEKPYKWRTPFGNGVANYSEGIRNDFDDDKANYIYGEKELWYIDRIETKNTIAIFTLEDRKDGYEVAGRNGGIGEQSMKLLRKISLYSKPDYEALGSSAVPIKEVHFEYDYSLCLKTENNIDTDPSPSNTNQPNTGKLTLKKVYFTYGSSTRSAFSPYTFDYTNLYDANFNPEYGLKNHNRWGNYKKNEGQILDPEDDPTGAMPNSDYPYVKQDKGIEDKNSTAWTLSKINLPSGGSITIHAESDDYAYVQNKKAMQMFTVESSSLEENPNDPNDFFGNSKLITDKLNLTEKSNKNLQYLSFKLDEPIPVSGSAVEDFRDKYLDGIDQLYFKFLVNIASTVPSLDNKKNYEYVSGYAEIEGSGLKSYNDPNGHYNYGYIKLKEVNQGDGSSPYNVNPISKAAWHFGRSYMPQLIYRGIDEEAPGVQKFISKIRETSFTKQIFAMLQGANGVLKNRDFGKEFLPDKSFIRLLNPTRKKLGGGLRVKKIELNDEWDQMVTGNSNQTYGQEYSYTTIDPETGEEISSGVAAWEPQIGGDENPFHLPIWFGDKDERLLMPDDRSFLNGPMGQEFYPSPSVGYSKVTVKNLSHVNINRHATGRIVNEYYTAKDYPTISRSTTLDPKQRKSSPLKKLFKIHYRDYMTASQGHVVELNDMHGKQKAMWVYQEGRTRHISGVQYKYKSERLDGNSFKLVNDATVVYPTGKTATKTIGLEYDITADFREHKSSTISAGLNANLSNFLAGVVPIPIPSVFPSSQQEFTRFRSAVLTKIVNRHGILEETIAHDLGSQVSTKNMAYDSESGLVLLTKTKNNFEDEIYNFNYPAHWYYDAMGQAYKNLGLEFNNLSISSSGIISMSNADDYFVPGDEVIVDNLHLGWVKNVSGASVELMNELGNAFYPNSGTIGTLTITRSGRRNLIGVSMGSITTLSNPLEGLKSNTFSNVLNTSSQVFKDEWKTFCECFENNDRIKNSKNGYVIGTKGVWRAYKSYAYLVDRKHSWKNNNTDIRNDGVYTSYNPFWSWNGASWSIDENNWTWNSEITEMSPYGAELENKDALGRFSAAVYGYNQTIPTAIGLNTSYSEIAFDGFEDYDFETCSDDHFSYKPFILSINPEAHTGKKSISVSAGNNISVNKILVECP